MITAELIGADLCHACGLTVQSTAPVLALCRKLIEAGHDPNETLEAYRGNVLAIRVRSLAEGAGLTVTTNASGTPVFGRHSDGAKPTVAPPPIRQNLANVPEQRAA